LYNYTWGVPHFVKYKGAGEYVNQNNQVQKLIFLEKAKGKSLGMLMAEQVLGTQNYSVWSSIGKALAKYHLAFGEVQGNTYISHTHGDLHNGNIFVNVSKDDVDLCFLDYATLSYFKTDISIDLKEIFGRTYQHVTGPFMEYVKNQAYNICDSFEEVCQYLNTIAKNIQSLFGQIKQGYVNEFASEGLNINIDDDGQAVLTSYPVVARSFKLAPVSQIATLGSFLQAAKKRADAAKVHLPPLAVKPAPKAKAKPAPKVAVKPAPKAKAKPAPKVAVKPAPKVIRKAKTFKIDR